MEVGGQLNYAWLEYSSLSSEPQPSLMLCVSMCSSSVSGVLCQQRACNEKSWLQVLVLAHVFTDNI